jgi:type VI secretion system protein ImpL
MMNFLRWLGRFFFNKQMLIFVGLVCLSLLVWFVGPIVAVGSVRPLELEWIRWAIIGSLFALYALKLLISWWRRRNINARLINQLTKVKDDAASMPKGLGEEEIAELRTRFQTALTTLKKARFQGAGGDGFSRFTKQYLYQLPWYMFIGAPGSGKTTALANSGLTFPLEDQLGKSAIHGVGGTRNCDWWFTNEAVLLDTAGRYSTHESNQELDKAEWSGFLELLKKFRTRQPLNGVLLTISVSDLLSMPTKQRTEHAIALRKRLYELREILKIQFPVYLVVTKCDLLSGFHEYFNNLGKEERAQVWGFTLPYSEKLVANPAVDINRFNTEFDLLQQRIFAGLNERLLDDNDLQIRAQTYAFPQHFAGIKDVLSEITAGLFTDSKFGESPLLRGVYFTSGTQEGTPFDRVLGVLARTFSVGAEASRSIGSQAQGRSFFLQDLMLKVIFPEANLAGRNFKWERKVTLLRNFGYAACALGLVGTLTAWALSYRNNQSYLTDVAAKVDVASKAVQVAGKDPNSDLIGLSELLDNVRDIPSTEKFRVETPPLPYTYGLYQGQRVDSSAAGAYVRLLDDGLLPYISKRIEQNLQAPQQADNLEASYETLKAYLMLHQPQHFNAKFLKDFSAFMLTRELPATASIEQKERLQNHVANLFDGRAISSPFEKDDALIKRTRDRLSQFSVAQLSYLRLKRELGQNELGEFTLAKSAGPQASLVFAFKSKKPLNNGIPGLFSYRGYHELFKKQVSSVISKFGKDESWVLDAEVKSTRQQLQELQAEKLSREVTALYLNEYANIWDAFLQDITLISPGTLQLSIQSARVLSAPDSPLSQFVKAAVNETTLLRPQIQDTQSLVGKATDKIKTGKEDLEKIFGTGVLSQAAPPKERLELIVDNRFEALRRLGASPPGSQSPPLIDSSVLPLINELYTALTATDAALRAGNQPPQTEVSTKMRAEAARLPMPLRAMFENLASASAAQSAGIARANLTASLDGSVGDFCRRAIAGRYPLVRGASKEVTPGDFSQLFSPGGSMDDFYQKNLANLVDVSTTPWSFKRGVDGAPAGGSAALGAFQRAKAIQEVFFRGARTPSLNISMKVVEMDTSIQQLILDVDGQTLRYSHGPQLAQSIAWPGNRGSNQVRLQLTPQITDSTGLLTEGPWALHRFFDKAQITAGASPERFIATINLDGRKAVFEVVTNSVQNPFSMRALSDFSCPGR